MKVLLIHPEDDLLGTAWSQSKWDCVWDLGRSGVATYLQASRHFGCEVRALDSLRSGFEEIHKVRELIAVGLGKLQDRYGIDWWELTSIMIHQDMEAVVLLSQFVKALGSSDHVYVTRPSIHSRILKQWLGERLQEIPRADTGKRGARHYVRLLKKFPARQLLDIFWDKTDSGYQLRGRIAKKKVRNTQAVVLLPSAYINVTRTGLAYARTLPDAQFFLVATRRSGWTDRLPCNVSAAWLQSYAAVDGAKRAQEKEELLSRWSRLLVELEQNSELGTLVGARRFDDFPERIARGLEIRDAWKNVLDREPVSSVLCADDSNPNTHIPLLLAKTRGLPVVTCHHGALDGRHMFKQSHADVVLAKGEMEKDYLTRVCALPNGKVRIGSPATAALPFEETPNSATQEKNAIVFFSETYEVSGGRGRDFYRDVLPPLADLAIRENRELVIKLHPFESLTERKTFIENILSAIQRENIRIISGPLEQALFDRTWFAVTVLSTVAVECALRKIPCFLCSWLECWPYGYVDQFVRFGVAQVLKGPDAIRGLPQLLTKRTSLAEVRNACMQPVQEKMLETWLGIGNATENLDVRQGSVECH